MRASDIRRGQAVIIDGKLFVVTNADHNTPGNLRAKVQFKLRDVGKGTRDMAKDRCAMRCHSWTRASCSGAGRS